MPVERAASYFDALSRRQTCQQCGKRALGGIAYARQCRACGAWTVADRAPTTRDSPAAEWRALALSFVRDMTHEEAQLALDRGRARARGQVEWERSLAAL